MTRRTESAFGVRVCLHHFHAEREKVATLGKIKKERHVGEQFARYARETCMTGSDLADLLHGRCSESWEIVPQTSAQEPSSRGFVLGQASRTSTTSRSGELDFHPREGHNVDSKTAFTISRSPSVPSNPVLQLLTATLTAPWPLHLVALTYIFPVPLIAAVNLDDEVGSEGGYAEVSDPLNRTMFRGTIG